MLTPIDHLVVLSDEALRDNEVQARLYAALRREQSASIAAAATGASEPRRILFLAQAAYRDLDALLRGRPSALLATARDGEWSLRDLLRHAIAVELRYCDQAWYSATRRDDEPLRIPEERLPCDRLAPPDADYADSRNADIARVLELLGVARERTDSRLAELRPSVLTRPSLWGAHEIDVRERLHQIAAHLIEVTLQAEKMLAAAGETSGEARRIVRRIWTMRGLHERLTSSAELRALDEKLAAIARLPV